MWGTTHPVVAQLLHRLQWETSVQQQEAEAAVVVGGGRGRGHTRQSSHGDGANGGTITPNEALSQIRHQAS